jgi:hypothetical protein
MLNLKLLDLRLYNKNFDISSYSTMTNATMTNDEAELCLLQCLITGIPNLVTCHSQFGHMRISYC